MDLLCSLYLLPHSVWRTTGEAADVGREVAEWLSEFLGEEGCRLFYMSPQHRARDMLADQEWNDLCREGEEVDTTLYNFQFHLFHVSNTLKTFNATFFL